MLCRCCSCVVWMYNISVFFFYYWKTKKKQCDKLKINKRRMTYIGRRCSDGGFFEMPFFCLLLLTTQSFVGFSHPSRISTVAIHFTKQFFFHFFLFCCELSLSQENIRINAFNAMNMALKVHHFFYLLPFFFVCLLNNFVLKRRKIFMKNNI